MRRLFMSMALTAFCCLPSVAVASLDVERLEEDINAVPRSIQMDLYLDGFNTISEAVLDNVLKKLKRIDIPSQEFSLAPIVTAELNNIQLDADWRSLDIRPYQNGLKVQVSVQDLHVKVHELVLKAYLLPFLKSTCTDTSITLGQDRAVPVTAKLGADIRDRKIELKDDDLEFTIADDQYDSQGPDDCRGPFGIRDVISEFVLSTLLKYAKGIITDQVKKQFGKALPKVEKLVNQYANLKMPIDLEEQLIFPETRMALGLFPHKMDISDKAMKLEMGVRVSPLIVFKEDVQPDFSGEPVLLGAMGINPETINVILAAVFENGGPQMRIDKNLHDMIGQVLRTDELSYFWPDLETLDVDHPEMRAFIAITSPPKIVSERGSNQLLLMIDDFLVRLQVRQDQSWRNYYHLLVDAQIGALLAAERQQVQINLSGKINGMHGEWPEDYVPADETFAAKDAVEVFSNLMDFGFGQLNPVRMKLPIINAKGIHLGLDKLRIDQPFVKIDVLRYH